MAERRPIGQPVFQSPEALVERVLGHTIAHEEDRQTKLQAVRGGLKILVTLNGVNWTLDRIAQMIVDEEDWSSDIDR